VPKWQFQSESYVPKTRWYLMDENMQMEMRHGDEVMHSTTTVCNISFINGYFGDETRISKGDFAEGFVVFLQFYKSDNFCAYKSHTFR